MNWYVFSTVEEDADESVSTCGSYDEAVKEAQAKHQTERRPKRIKAGWYRISHMANPGRYRENASYIVSYNKMIAYGFGRLLTSVRSMKRPNLDGLIVKSRRA